MKQAAVSKKPSLAVWKFSSCDGCQLALLDCEEHLLDVAGAVDIAYFLEAGPEEYRDMYDVSLVEGSVSTPWDIERIQDIRRRSRFLVAIGACAVSGGWQALRNFTSLSDVAGAVYPRPGQLHSLDKSTPISAHVKVDYELRGCPISKDHLLELLSAFLQGRKPYIPTSSVCQECKFRGNVCVLVARGIPCLGPAVQAGCGALCPTYGRGCYGCFGPQETPNTASLSKVFQDMGMEREDLVRIWRQITGYSGPFSEESMKHE